MSIYAIKKPKRINSVSVGLTIILAGILYLGYAMLPVMWPLWQVGGMMRSTCAQSFSSVGDDAELLKKLVRETRRTRLRISVDNFQFEREPYSDAELENLPAARRDQLQLRGKTCVIRFRYDDEYELPLLGIRYRLPYESSSTYDLQESEGGSMSNPLYDLAYNSCTCTSVGR